MVGPWPLAPNHDHLQYIHHVHLMQRGQNWGVTLSHMLPLDLNFFLNHPYPIASPTLRLAKRMLPCHWPSGKTAPWTWTYIKMKCLNINHAKMHNHSHTQWKKTYIHSGIQHVHHSSLTLNMIVEVKWTRILIFKRTRFATSYVASTFHPTIGQRAP